MSSGLSLRRSTPSNTTEPLTIECVAGSDVADGRLIDFLKIDCEGSEWAILEDPRLLRRTKRSCIEYHLFDGRAVADLGRLVADGGHHVVRTDGLKENGKYGLLHTVHSVDVAPPA